MRARLTQPSVEFLHAFARPTQQPATFCFASQPRPSGSHQFHVSQCASPTHAAQHSAELFAAFLPRPWHCVSPRSSGKAAASQAEVRKASMVVSEVKRWVDAAEEFCVGAKDMVAIVANAIIMCRRPRRRCQEFYMTR